MKAEISGRKTLLWNSIKRTTDLRHMYNSAADTGDDVSQQPGSPAIASQVLDDREIADHPPTNVTWRRTVARRQQRTDPATQRTALGGIGVLAADELAVERRLVIDWTRNVDATRLQRHILRRTAVAARWLWLHVAVLHHCLRSRLRCF